MEHLNQCLRCDAAKSSSRVIETEVSLSFSVWIGCSSDERTFFSNRHELSTSSFDFSFIVLKPWISAIQKAMSLTPLYFILLIGFWNWPLVTLRNFKRKQKMTLCWTLISEESLARASRHVKDLFIYWAENHFETLNAVSI